MGGGGGGFFGTILNIVSLAVPVLRPVAIAYNIGNSVANGNVLGAIGGAFGAYNYASGLDGFGMDQGVYDGPIDDWTSNATGGLGDIGGGWLTDPTTGMETWSGDAAPGVDPSLIQGADGSLELPSWTQSNVFDNMDNFNPNPTADLGKAINSLNTVGDTASQGNFGSFNMGGLKGGVLPGSTPDTAAFNTSSMALDTGNVGNTVTPTSNMDFTGDPSSSITTPGVINIEGMGTSVPETGQEYDWTKNSTGGTGTGQLQDWTKNSTGGSEYMQKEPSFWEKMNKPMKGPGGVQATPLGLAGRGLGALFDVKQGIGAEDMLKSQLERGNAWADQNAARGASANNMWMQSQQDPMYGYDAFMRGAGKTFMDQSRAVAAKNGNRSAALTKLPTALADLWQKNQTQRSASIAGGFSNSNPYSSTDQLATAAANQFKNRYSPISNFTNYASNFNLSDLYS